MLGPEDFRVIEALARRGVYLCDIAKQLGVHPRTVRRALDRGGPPVPRRGRRGSLLDPYRSLVDELLAEGVWNAVVIGRELPARGELRTGFPCCASPSIPRAGCARAGPRCALRPRRGDSCSRTGPCRGRWSQGNPPTCTSS